jgi:hypothetical protein
MQQRRANRFWNHLVLGTLVLLVAGAALGTVASAAAESRTPGAIGTVGSP